MFFSSCYNNICKYFYNKNDPIIDLDNNSIIFGEIRSMKYINRIAYHKFKKITIGNPIDDYNILNLMLKILIKIQITHLTIIHCDARLFNDVFLLDNLPQTLLYLKICLTVYSREYIKNNYFINNLPKSLKYFKITVAGIIILPLNNLPSDLFYFEYSSDYFSSFDNLPGGLLYLCLIGNFNKSCDNLPNKLIYLDLAKTIFNHSINLLPNSLIILKLPKIYTNNIYKLTNTVHVIIFSSTFSCYLNPKLYLQIKHNQKLRSKIFNEIYFAVYSDEIGGHLKSVRFNVANYDYLDYHDYIYLDSICKMYQDNQ